MGHWAIDEVSDPKVERHSRLKRHLLGQLRCELRCYFFLPKDIDSSELHLPSFFNSVVSIEATDRDRG